MNKAMSNSEEYTIDGVPFDSRQGTYAQFEAHMERRGPRKRVHLLCSAAYKGSGKTTLLHINMKWFVDATKGIAIHVTFNDEQCSSQGIWKMQAIESRHDFESTSSSNVASADREQREFELCRYATKNRCYTI